jgi:ADP-ribose pyrophosphatase
MPAIRTLERRPLLRVGDGRFLQVEQHVVEFGDGRRVEDWGWVVTPEFINIVPVLQDGRVLCFRQEKYAARGLTLSVPGGYLEMDEDPLAAAQRELLEETGYGGGRWTALGSFVVDGNRGAGRGHFFLAQGVEWRQPANADDLESLEPLLLTPAEVRAALLAGEFQVMPWSACVALALLHLEQTPDDSPDYSPLSSSSMPPAGSEMSTTSP